MRVILCSCPENEAEHIAKTILMDKLAACVNIIPGVRSLYVWKDQLCDEKEAILLIKSRAHLMDRLINKINESHSYDTVEIISLEIKEGDKKYLKWIEDVTS